MSSLPHDVSVRNARRRVGASLSGRYHIRRLIGIGGMAAVYAGVHRNGHVVAIKILHERLSSDPEMERLFRREALLANQIGHPGVVPVIDDDVNEDGSTFLVMPLLAGETLRARAERLGGRLPVPQVVAIGRSVLDVLAAAHARRIVHRDIKPDNLFITSDGELRVLDFGIARFFDTLDPVSATRSGRAVGTPAFMAPEQALGRLRDIDGRTDLWALGATMFSLLAGRFVHEGESGNELLVHAATRPARELGAVAPEVPASIAAVVDKALAFDRSSRWPDASAMAIALIEASGGSISSLPHLAAPPAARSRVGVHFMETLRSIASNASPPPPSVDHAIAGVTERLRAASTRTTSAAMLAARTPRAQPSSRRLRALFVSTAIVALLVLGAIGARSLRWAPLRASYTSPSAPLRTPVETRAARGYRDAPWLRSWLDGDATRVRDDATRALERNPSDASAHLAYVVAAHFWFDPAARAHFREATALRDQLAPYEIAYLEAIAPGMTVPPDFHLAIVRLQPLLDAAPQDAVVRMALADMKLRLNDLNGSAEVIGPLVANPDAPGIALSRYAAIAAVRDDVDTARTSYTRCLATQPGSQVCAEPLVELEMNEGQCAAAERVLRQQLSITPDPIAYLTLAYVLQSQGANADAVSSVLRKWVDTSTPEERKRNELQAQIKLSLMIGRLSQALREYDTLGALLSDASDDPSHFYYTRSRMILEADLGDLKAAASTLSRYESSRDALQRDVAGEDNVSYLQATGVAFGVVPWKTWVAERDLRLAHPSEVDEQLDGQSRSWLQHFAIPTTTAAAARIALDALPHYLPLLSRPSRDYALDAAIARVYAFGGQPLEALPYAERAVSSCAGLDDLIQFHQGEVELAELYSQLGDKRACAMYERVVKALPPSSGSAIGRRAAEGAAHQCAVPSSGKREVR